MACLSPIAVGAGSTSATVPSVANTLVLANDTLIRGNVLISNAGVSTPNPLGMAFDTSNGDLYVTMANSNSVVVINGATSLITDNITVGYNPLGVVYDPSNGFLYVVNGLDDRVSVINGATNKVVANITVGPNPTSAAYDSWNGKVFVAQYSPGGITSKVIEVDTTTNTIVNSVTIPGEAIITSGLAFDPANGKIYAASYSASKGGISVLDGTTDSIVGEVTGLKVPSGVAFDSANGCLYVSEGTSMVAVINATTNTLVAHVSIAGGPSGLGYDSVNGYIYVADTSNSVSVIDGGSNTVIQNFSVGNAPKDVAFDSQGTRLFVSNSGTISIIPLSQGVPSATNFIVLASAAVTVASVLSFALWKRHGSSDTGKASPTNQEASNRRSKLNPVS